MVTDELKHLDAMEDAGISYVSGLIEISEVACSDTFAAISATENSVFSSGDQSIREAVLHEVRVFITEENELMVSADGYYEESSGFFSCSYVDGTDNSASIMAVGSLYCISEVARNELGYTEDYDNITKYGWWIGFADGHGEWCAAFVSWCANQANISTSIIPKETTVAAMRNFFLNKGTYYLSASQGGSMTPRAGDLFFENGSASSPGHIGIITYVTADKVYGIDGNSMNKVMEREFSISASNLVAFARPQYGATNHSGGSTFSYNATHHWRYCVNCNAVTGKVAHILLPVQADGTRKCRSCDYTIYAVVNSLKSRGNCCH